MDEIRLAAMAERHLDALAELERLCFSQPWSRRGLAAELTDPSAYFLVAERGDSAVGYAGMHCVLDECYIANVAVHPDFRRGGIGKMLLRGLFDFAVRRESGFLSLEVRQSNAAAIALYEREGFRRAGLRRNFYTSPVEDGLIMTKYLEDGSP